MEKLSPQHQTTRYSLEEIGCQLGSLENESWRYVAGTNNAYLISTQGRLLTRNWRDSGRDSMMKPAYDANMYLRTMIVRNGKARTIKLHRLVAEAFLPNPLNKPQVNHK